MGLKLVRSHVPPRKIEFEISKYVHTWYYELVMVLFLVCVTTTSYYSKKLTIVINYHKLKNSTNICH